MAPAYKHGGHRIALGLQALGAGTSADTSELFVYDGEAASILGTYDASVEVIQSAVLAFDATVAGAATNYFSVVLAQYSSAGVLKNEVEYSFQSGVNATAFVPIDLSGPVAGGLTNPTGVPIQGDGWLIAEGDVFQVKRLSTGTGLASPGFGVTLKIGSYGS